VSTTPGNPGNPGHLMEFKDPPGNPGNFLECSGHPGNFCVRIPTALVSSHKIGIRSLLKKLVALYHLCNSPMLYKLHIMFLVAALHHMLH